MYRCRRHLSGPSGHPARREGAAVAGRVPRAAGTDLPSCEELTGIDLPTLILGWIGDSSHPMSTAEIVHEALASSRLVVARTPADVETWPARIADHVNGVEDPVRRVVRGRR